MNIFGRVVATVVVGCGAYASASVASATVTAVENIDRTDNALADLSHYIADAHVSIRERVAAAGPRADVIADFNASVDRRLARLRSQDAVNEGQPLTPVWMQPMQGDADVRRIDEDRSAYVNAAKTTLTTPVFDPARSLRLFDLQAQKLIQTVAAVRDGAATARARALVANETAASVASGLGALVIAYLIWLPVFGGVRRGPEATSTSTSTSTSS